jgi:hypothetical protein
MSGTIGIAVADVLTSSSAPAFRLGTVGILDHPTNGYQEFIYGRADGAVTAAGYVCGEKTDNDWKMLTTTTAAAAGVSGPGSRIGVAMAAIADNGFGWFQIYGKASVRTLASDAAGSQQFSTATAGCIDDAVSGSALFGVRIGTSTGGAEATNSDCFLNRPFVGLVSGGASF